MGRDFVPPDLLAGLRIEADHPVVMHREIDVVVPHADAACLERSAASRFPVVVPEDRAITRVDRVDVERRSRVDDAVDEQHPAAGTSLTTAVRLASPETSDDDGIRGGAAATASSAATATPGAGTAGRADWRSTGRAAASRQRRDPLEAQVLDRAGVDLLRRLEALPLRSPEYVRHSSESGFRMSAGSRPPTFGFGRGWPIWMVCPFQSG
jgi:hypothetical protein